MVGALCLELAHCHGCRDPVLQVNVGHLAVPGRIISMPGLGGGYRTKSSTVTPPKPQPAPLCDFFRQYCRLIEVGGDRSTFGIALVILGTTHKSHQPATRKDTAKQTERAENCCFLWRCCMRCISGATSERKQGLSSRTAFLSLHAMTC